MPSEMQERIMGALDRVFREQAGRAASLEDLSLAVMKAMLEPTGRMLEAAEWAAEDGALLDFDRGDFRLTFTAAISHEIAAAEEA